MSDAEFGLESMLRLQGLGVRLWLEGDTVRFSAPRGVLSPDLKEMLRARKASIRAYLQHAAREALGGEQAVPIERAPRDAPLPLSFAQQRLWFFDQWEPGSPAYNTQGAVRLEGPLDVAVLRQALVEILRRHEALRTTFVVVDGQPCQVIALEPSLDLPVVDLRALPEQAREEAARRLAAEGEIKLFDLATGPLLRVTALRLDDQEYVLLMTTHHIVCDGWSSGVLVRELAALYAAFRAGEPSPLPPLPVQYADYAVWQRRLLEGPLKEKQLAYWKQQLAGAPPLLELPTDRPRPPVQRFRGAEREFQLPAALTAQLAALGERAGATRFMTLLAAFQLLLARYARATDVCVGSPVAGRTRIELEGLIGLFVNTVVLRADLSGDPTFLTLLERVRKVTLEASDHQDLPFEQVVDAVQRERDPSRSPLFQVVFVLQNAPTQALTLADVELGPFPVEVTTATVDLWLSLEDEGEGMRGRIRYNTDLFDAPTIHRLLAHYEALLESAARAPERRVSELSMLSAGERRKLLVEWNQTERAAEGPGCVHERFEAQVERAPDTIAATFGAQRLTYGELNRRANQLAHRLRSFGVAPRVFVGVCVERSLDLVVAALGVLKAGGIYVPLDPSYPLERLRFMLQDAGVSVLITQERLANELPVHESVLICLDAEAESLREEPDDNPVREATPDDLAYAIYTSGSTGAPKGVVVEHRGLCNLAEAQREAFDVRPGTRLLQFARIGFDVSVGEIFTALLGGGTLCLAPEDALLPGPSLVDLLRCEDVHVLMLTPSALAILPSAPLPALRTLILGGEVCPAELVDRWAPGRRFYSIYGPTETTVAATLTEWGAGRGRPPIGRPIANTQVYVLDAILQPVAEGVVGELYVGGQGLAQGYLRRPALTAERFVPSPFSAAPGARLYRTGDLCRYRSDGVLEFVGRVDHQVKLRGFRIELGEIEAALGQHPAVREAVALVREDAPGDRRLVAYVVVREAQAASAEALRACLKDRLPEYMLPEIVPLQAFPLTPAGKVDRRALPAPKDVQREPDQAFVAPRTPFEQEVASVWAELLGRARLGVEAHFFDLGGHSLLATRVVARIRQQFGVELPVRALFEAPTVAAFAERMEAARRTGAGRSVPALRRLPRQGPPPLSFAQQRLWFLDQLEPQSPLYNIPVAVHLDGPLDAAALNAGLREVTRRHEVLRTSFAVIDGEPRQIIAPEPSLELPLVDLRALPPSKREARVRQLAAEEATRPFDLGRGPLVRARLLCSGAQEHVLLLTMHHTVSDGWSAGVLLKELAALYSATREGRHASLPELPLQYADYAVWQREHLEGGVREAQLEYWKQQLAGAPAYLDLPTDRPRPVVQSSRGASAFFSVPAEHCAELDALCQRAGVTRFMALLGVFQLLLGRYAGATDVCVGTPVAGRTYAEQEGLIGLFVNTLVLRADLSGDPTFLELLERVREITLQAYAHQDVPFEQVVEALSPERDLSRTPLFQVMFVLQNAPMPEMRLADDLTLRPLEFGMAVAKFDLTLSLIEVEGALQGALEYNADLFDAETIGRMLGHLQTLLSAALERPERRQSDLPLLSADERRRLLVAWNDTRVDVPPPACVHEFVEAHAAEAPEIVAAAFEGQRLTYGELNRRANQLAHALRAHGVGVEVPIGLCVERSLEMIIGVLGILKAGGVYVPLDPALPSERLAFLLQDVRPPILLTQQRLVERLPPHASRLLCLDTDEEGLAEAREHNPASGVAPENAAYVIYTSGSTGRPKGVTLEHRGLRNLAEGQRQLFGVRRGAAVLQFSRLSFDASVWEIFMALAAGATLHLAPGASLLAGEDLSALLRERGIEIATLPPSALASVPEGAYPALATLIVAGEACPPELVARWSPGRRFFNAYGPTETTVCATVAECSALPGRPPIGRPIANTQVYVLDAILQPVAEGVVGELYVGGQGLARGYLRRPALTAERFVPSPFSAAPGGRLYRTGDLCRYRSDGALEFVGRVDHQVKLRGFRVELGEIEATLGQHPAVREAAAVAQDLGSGDKRLIAFVVPREPPAPTPEALRAYLRDKLPEPMLPAAYVPLEALPLTSSGKLDRNALLALAGDALLGPGAAYVAPRDAVELELSRIWEEVLQRRPVGVREDFFALGGHSLLAVRLMAAIEARLGRRLPLAALFQDTTVEGLARRLREAMGPQPWSPLVAMQPAGRRRPFFCVHPAGGGVLSYAALTRLLVADRPIYGVQGKGADDDEAPDDCVEVMAARYIEALRVVQPRGPYLLGGASLGGLIAFEMARRLTQAGDEVALLALFDAAALSKDDLALGDETAHLLDYARSSGLQVEEVALRRLGPDEQMRLVHRLACDAGVLPQHMNVAQFTRWMVVTRAHFQAGKAYVPGPYPGRIALFRSSENPAPDLRLGWGSVVAGPVDVCVVPGTHTSILMEPNVQILAEKLSHCLREADPILAGNEPS